MLTIESASNPKYTSKDENSIDLNVKFLEFNEVLPFTATPFDNTSYGVELYNRAKANEFGIVEPYVAPTQPITTGIMSA